jgi:acyl carrier protein
MKIKFRSIWDKPMTKKVSTITFLKNYYRDVFKLDPSKFDLETKLNDTGIDSLEAFNLLYAIEDNYKIRFSDKFLPVTINDIVKETNRLKKEKLNEAG